MINLILHSFKKVFPFIVNFEVLDYILIQWLSPEHKWPHNELEKEVLIQKSWESIVQMSSSWN